jgi:hypothetical protein
VIANETPQTATIDRAQAKFAPVYDGSPRFEAIEGTELERAVNTRGAVIRLRGGACYAVENGVWFVASTPTGPWQTATYVPSEIYAIPPSSSLHYVTYARVYDATPTTVVVGYTPGYLGWYAPPGACVVYGSGWVYPAWVGTVWFGPPVTYGYWWAWGRPDPWWHHWGWGPYWGPSWGPYWARHGGYGPYGPHGPYGPYGPYGPHGPYWHGPARPVFAGGVAHSGNLYSTWGGKVVARSATVGGAAGRAATLRTQGLGTSASDRTRTPGTLGMPNSNRAGTAKPIATGSKGEASSRLLKEPRAEKVHESPRASPREFREPRGGSMRMPRGGGRR